MSDEAQKPAKTQKAKTQPLPDREEGLVPITVEDLQAKLADAETNLAAMRSQFDRQEAREAELKRGIRINVASQVLQGMLSSRVGVANFGAIPESQRRLMVRTAYEFADILIELNDPESQESASGQ
jgi:alkylation response protein AidB-like acyl-CoA dehydrogenase